MMGNEVAIPVAGAKMAETAAPGCSFSLPKFSAEAVSPDGM
jgi:hypothetical protein